MSVPILGRNRLKDFVITYRRLPPVRKIAIWIGLSLVAIFLLRGSGAGLPFRRPPRPPHRGPHFPPSSPGERKLWKERREVVKEAFQHAYGGYERFAFGRDELKPLTNGTVDNLNGWGLTIVDSLDTMILMDSASEVDRAISFIQTLNFTQPSRRMGFFETTIRYVGGLLSAYHLMSISPRRHYRDSYAPILLQKTEELSEVLHGAFDTTSGLPDRWIRVVGGHGEPIQPHGTGSLAEMASCQMEFKYLSHITRDPKYFTSSQKVMEAMEREQGKTPVRVVKIGDDGNKQEELSTDFETGLWTNYFYLDTGRMYGGDVSAGAMGDSAYEYLLKQYLLSGRTEKHILDMYLKAMDGVINHLLYLSPKHDLLYMTDLGSWSTPTGKFEHLSCYMPGVLALGARLLDPAYPWPDSLQARSDYVPPYSPRLRSRAPVHVDEHALQRTLDLHMRAAKGLAYTCWSMYASTESGIGPEIVTFRPPDYPEDMEWEPRNRYIPAKWGPRVEEWEKNGREGPLVGTEERAGKKKGVMSGVIAEEEWDWDLRDQRYLLRPEAIEAMYLLWKTTGDKKWRERGWKMFEAVNLHTRAEHGYASVQFAPRREPTQINEMPSFFLAETLKYSYLLMIEPEDDPLPLDRIVFNTEAHPLPMFQWTPEERSQYNIH